MVRSGFAALCRRRGIDFSQCVAITGASPEVVAALWRASDRAGDADPDLAAAVDRLLQVVIAEDDRGRMRTSASASDFVDHRGLTPMAATILLELLEAPSVAALSLTTTGAAEGLRELLDRGSSRT